MKEKKAKRENAESRCRLSFGLSFSLTKRQSALNSVFSVSVLQVLTSHGAIKEVLMRPGSDLF